VNLSDNCQFQLRIWHVIGKATENQFGVQIRWRHGVSFARFTAGQIRQPARMTAVINATIAAISYPQFKLQWVPPADGEPVYDTLMVQCVNGVTAVHVGAVHTVSEHFNTLSHRSLLNTLAA